MERPRRIKQLGDLLVKFWGGGVAREVLSPFAAVENEVHLLLVTRVTFSRWQAGFFV